MSRRDSPAVSVVVAFLNPGRFIDETIQSVHDQSFDDWELLLVDDGSTDESTAIARAHAARIPERVRYLEHADHMNRGVSASRNLGVEYARGEFMAFLDADDVWLPTKLDDQIGILRHYPQVAMVYGASLYWRSWTGRPEDRRRDRLQPHGIRGDRMYDPPELLRYFLMERAVVPTPASVLVRRAAVEAVGGFDESFRSLIDDQVFYAKICLRYPVFVSSTCWDRYRQHDGSSCATASALGMIRAAHVKYLRWLSEYLRDQPENQSQLMRVVKKELEYYENPSPHMLVESLRFVRRAVWKLWTRSTTAVGRKAPLASLRYVP